MYAITIEIPAHSSDLDDTVRRLFHAAHDGGNLLGRNKMAGSNVNNVVLDLYESFHVLTEASCLLVFESDRPGT